MTTGLPLEAIDTTGASEATPFPKYDHVTGVISWAGGASLTPVEGEGIGIDFADPEAPVFSNTGVLEVVAGANVSVNLTDPRRPVVSAAGGGGGSAETWEDAVLALTGKVHRWKWEEASGSAVADEVGSLPITLTGGYTRDVTTLTGKGVTLDGTTGYGVTGGLGSLPVGAADRTVIVLFRTTTTVITNEQALFSYGTTATRGLYEITTDVGTARPNVNGTLSGDGPIMPTTYVTDATWHLMALGSYTSASVGVSATTLYLDSDVARDNQAANLVTTASGNLEVGRRVGGSRFAGITIDDLIVCDKWVGKAALDRLYRTLPAA